MKQKRSLAQGVSTQLNKPNLRKKKKKKKKNRPRLTFWNRQNKSKPRANHATTVLGGGEKRGKTGTVKMIGATKEKKRGLKKKAKVRRLPFERIKNERRQYPVKPGAGKKKRNAESH